MCVNGRCTKEGGACLICGRKCPPSRGVKPRSYCSARCSKAAQGRPPKPQSVPCGGCGKTVVQKSRGPTVQFCSSACRGSRVGGARICRGCGNEFRFIGPKQFCSDECRWPSRHPVKCKACGREFVRKRSKQVCCSWHCCGTLAGKRSEGRTKKYICLNCGVEFQKKKYKDGSRSCQKKYCSRDCAFEARRLKKPCAVRPREIGGKLASWFLSWGDDYFPYVYKCCECGASLQQKKDSAKHEKCWSCRARKDRFCIDCGSPELASLSVKRCEPCREAAKAALKKRQRRQRKRRHGNSHTIRKRCRHHNAPYTPVSRKKIFDRDNWTCQLCGMRLLARYTRLPDGGVHGLSPTVDHIIPLARGPDGPGHVESNCQAACWGCNTEKGAADPDSFAAGKATDLDSKAWQKAQHQRRSTSSRCEDQRKPTTARSLAPL